MPRPKTEFEIEVPLPHWWWAGESPRTPEERHIKLLSERMRTRLHKERRMLSQFEEEHIRRQIRDSTPMRSVNPMPAPQRDIALVPPKVLEDWKSEPKMAPVDLNSDYAVESKLRDAGFDGKPGEFFGAFGLSRPQVLSMPATEIRAHIERVRGSDDFAPPRATPKPEPRPRGPVFAVVGA